LRFKFRAYFFLENVVFGDLTPVFAHSYFLDYICHLMYNKYNTYNKGIAMHETYTTAEARKRFADLVNKVAYGKEQIVLTRKGQEMAALISIEELTLLQHIEDHLDIEDANKALSDSGDNVSAQEFWEKVGLR
jgi:antitoxin Phd